MKLKKEVARKNNLEIYTYNQSAMYSFEMSLPHAKRNLHMKEKGHRKKPLENSSDIYSVSGNITCEIEHNGRKIGKIVKMKNLLKRFTLERVYIIFLVQKVLVQI